MNHKKIVQYWMKVTSKKVDKLNLQDFIEIEKEPEYAEIRLNIKVKKLEEILKEPINVFSGGKTGGGIVIKMSDAMLENKNEQ